ncbi:CSE [Symbiodinium pilosum]|uniref:CSE protein n=1 Tax=Symbiodinium pilosum TaxID=2952 RepID=A0A812WLL2_SYMPI|nr:CSE [Symbiodinium pilosum]
MSALEIFDATVKKLAEAHIMVVLNNHQGKAMWCCSEDDGEGLWYSQEYSEEDWLQSLRLLARRYREEPYVIGFDLRNELRGIPASVAQNLRLSPRGFRFWPRWDSYDEILDLRRAGADAEVGNSDWGEAALRAGVVYEAHDYCWYHVNFFRAWMLYWRLGGEGWILVSLFQMPGSQRTVSYSAFRAKLDDRWGFLLDGEAPVWLGEFGTNGYWVTDGWSAEVGEVLWLNHILRYMQERDLHYAYWALNGDKAGDDETFGLLMQEARAVQGFEGLRLNGPSRLCDAGLQDGDLLSATIREPGPVMESYRKAGWVEIHNWVPFDTLSQNGKWSPGAIPGVEVTVALFMIGSAPEPSQSAGGAALSSEQTGLIRSIQDSFGRFTRSRKAEGGARLKGLPDDSPSLVVEAAALSLDIRGHMLKMQTSREDLRTLQTHALTMKAKKGVLPSKVNSPQQAGVMATGEGAKRANIAKQPRLAGLASQPLPRTPSRCRRIPAPLREAPRAASAANLRVSSLLSPRSGARSPPRPVPCFPANRAEASLPQAVVATPSMPSGISSAGGVAHATPVAAISGISSAGGMGGMQRQNVVRSYAPPRVVVPAWAWLPSLPSPKQAFRNPACVPHESAVKGRPADLAVIPTPSRVRTQRPPGPSFRVGPPIRATLSGGVPTAWHAVTATWPGGSKAFLLRVTPAGRPVRQRAEALFIRWIHLKCFPAMFVLTAAGGLAGGFLFHKWLLRPEECISPGAKAVAASSDVELKAAMHSLKDGSQRFSYTLKPKNKAPTHAIVFVHGYTSNSDLYVEIMAEYARAGAVVLMPDLPGHGRSDGLLAYITDWWSFMDQLWEHTEILMSKEGMVDGKSLPTFVAGNSLGGGMAACMVLQRPTYFRGAILQGPMLTVSDEVKPPWIVQMIFKHVVARLLPNWPLSPIKSLANFDFRVPTMGPVYEEVNPFSMKGTLPFLASGREMGFTFIDWLEDHLKEVRTPFLVQHGKSDKITDPASSQRLYDEAAATDKTLRLYDGVYHCELICCTPGGAAFTGLTWLPEQVSATEQCIQDAKAWMAARV